jgi:hypothetical protein
MIAIRVSGGSGSEAAPDTPDDQGCSATDPVVGCNGGLDSATCGRAASIFARERTIETQLTTRQERCRAGLRLAYRVTEVCNADARNHCRVAENGWCTGEVVEESNS